MKLSGFIAVLILMLSVFAYGQEPVSRFGKLQVVDDDDAPKHQLLLNGKAVFEHEELSIEILEVFKGKEQDYVILGLNSGGMACPMQVVIIELFKSGAHKTSEEFGSCSDLIETKFINGKVIVETPMYVPHPDLLSKRELKRRERLKEVYTWYQGKLVKSLKPR